MRFVKKFFRNKNAKSFFATKSEDEKFDYIGWIPNTTGHVYFRHATVRQPGVIDRYVVRPPTFTQTDCDQKIFTRYILATSLCDLNDLKPSITDAKFTRFVVVAKSENKHELIGDVWMIWDKRNNPSKSKFEQNVITLFERLEKQSEKLRSLWTVETEAIPHSIDKEGKFDENEWNISDLYRLKEIQETIVSFETDKKEIEDILDPIKSGEQEGFWVSRFKFNVSNTGFCYLKYSKSNISKQIEKKEDEIKAEIENAYYYLKFLLHMHHHHDRNLDSFCRLHKIPKEDKQYDDKYINLSKKLLRDIKVNLIEIKFNQAGKDAFTRNTKGIAAYATSLIQQFKAEKILQIDNSEHADFVNRESVYIDNLIKSIDVKQQEQSASSWLKILSMTNHLFVFIIAFVGALILFGVEIAKLKLSIPNKAICSGDAIDRTDFVGNLVIDLVCKDGMTFVISSYFTLLLVAVLFTYAGAYLIERGAIRNYLFTGFLKNLIIRIAHPSKITMPLSSSRNNEESYLITFRALRRKLRSVWYDFGYFREYKLLPFLSGIYYWKVTDTGKWRKKIIHIIAWSLYFLSICLIGIAIWTIFTFNEKAVVEELFGNKLFGSFWENLKTLFETVYKLLKIDEFYKWLSNGSKEIIEWFEKIIR